MLCKIVINFLILTKAWVVNPFKGQAGNQIFLRKLGNFEGLR